MPTPEEEVNSLLEGCDAHRPGMIERNEPLVAALGYFLDLKKKADSRVTHVTLGWFYENKLRDTYRGPRSMHTVRDFVRAVLKRDPITGKTL